MIGNNQDPIAVIIAGCFPMSLAMKRFLPALVILVFSVLIPMFSSCNLGGKPQAGPSGKNTTQPDEARQPYVEEIPDVKAVKEGNWTHYSFPSIPLSCRAEKSWKGKENGKEVIILDGLSIPSVYLNPDFVCKINEDKRFLWVATQGSGLWRMDTTEGRWENMSYSQDYKSRHLQFVITTDDEAAWFRAGADRGIQRYDKQLNAWKYYENLELLYCLKDGRIFATRNDSILEFDKQTAEFVHSCQFKEKGKYAKLMMCSPAPAGNSIWFEVEEYDEHYGVRRWTFGGFARFDCDTGKIRFYSPATDNALSGLLGTRKYWPPITSSALDGDDLWVASPNIGVFHYEAKHDRWEHPLKINRGGGCSLHQIVIAPRMIYFIPYREGSDGAADSESTVKALKAYNKSLRKLVALKPPQSINITCAGVAGENLYIGTAEGSVWLLDEEGRQWEKVYTIESPIGSIEITESHIYLLTCNGLFVRERNRLE